MCGFGISTIFQVAIFIIVVLVVLALLRADIIQIVIGGVIAILVLLFIWKLAECAGLIGGRLGMLPWSNA